MSAVHSQAGIGQRGHICWIVEDEQAFRKNAATYLAEGRSLGEKTAALGPEGSELLAELGKYSDVIADPYVEYVKGQTLQPETLFAKFREEAARAAEDGYAGLRVMADMNWLLPLDLSAEQIIGYELLLDRMISESKATLVCAYRPASFDEKTITGAVCTHPVASGGAEKGPFCLAAGEGTGWRLSGEVDRAALAPFAAAFQAGAYSAGEFDVSGLEFIDVAGMRAIAEAAQASNDGVQLRGASDAFRRMWSRGGFAEMAPNVELAD